MCSSDALRRGVLYALLLPQVAAAGGPLPDLPPAPPTQMVRELLVLDAQRALAAEQAKMALAPLPIAPAAATPGGATPQDQPIGVDMVHLRAIYGLGSMLQAEVAIGSQRVIYRAGRPQPTAGVDSGYRLARIAAPCVALTDPAGKSLQRCLSGRQP